MSHSFTLRELAERLGGRLEGNGSVTITGVGALASAGPGEITFVLDARRLSALPASRAGAAIVPEDAEVQAPMPLLRVKHVQAALADLLGILGENESRPPAGVHPSAVLGEGVEMGRDVAIGPGVVVGAGAKLGDGVVLCPNVTVAPGAVIGAGTVLLAGTVIECACRIGRRCRIGPNAVIGGSGFGYFPADGRHRRVPHAGTVEIGDEVDIGACSCVDRAKFGATRIGDGTKIDNLVQVAHNCQIGRGCLLAGLVGVGGSVVLKDFTVLGGHAGVRDNIIIGSRVRASAFAAIAQDVPDGTTVAGVPAREARRQLRIYKTQERLPELRQRLRNLEKRLRALESAEDHQGTG